MVTHLLELHLRFNKKTFLISVINNLSWDLWHVSDEPYQISYVGYQNDFKY